MKDSERLWRSLDVIESAMELGLFNGPQHVTLYQQACIALGIKYECKDVQKDTAAAATFQSDRRTPRQLR